MKSVFFVFFSFFFLFSPFSFLKAKQKKPSGSIPHILVASRELKKAQYFPPKKYRLFKVNSFGKVIPIPFQIDEKDENGDYVLGKEKSDEIFSDLDELSFMSEDAGDNTPPKTWGFKKPKKLYKLTLRLKTKKKTVYLGIYSDPKPPKESLSTKHYVNFDLKKGFVQTKKYKYFFNKKNYLVVDDFYIEGQKKPLKKVFTSSSFYLNLNLKYFFSLSLDHKDIQSKLEAHKVGPIRAIARVDFNYKALAMKIDLGMYTEVAFFKETILLPAVLESPLDGKKLLKKPSLFYYGFALIQNPKTLKLSSNMSPYPKIDKTPPKDFYWLSTVGKDYQIYMEFLPSKSMMKNGLLPWYFVGNKNASQLSKRKGKSRDLKKSPTNIALAFDIALLSEGVHEIELALFVDKRVDSSRLNDFKNYKNWVAELTELGKNKKRILKTGKKNDP